MYAINYAKSCILTSAWRTHTLESFDFVLPRLNSARLNFVHGDLAVKSLLFVSCLFLSFALALAPSQAATLTTIDFPGSDLTEATGINSSGQIVGFYGIGFGPTQGFLLSGGVFTTISFPKSNVSTWCEGINDNGDIVGFYIDPTGDGQPHGYVMQGGVFTQLDYPGAMSTQAYGINNAGQIVGEYQPVGPGTNGFLFNSGTYTSISVSGAVNTQMRGIDNLGDMVGRYLDTAGSLHGLLVSHGIQHFLNAPGATSTYANGVNDRKHIVGYEDVPGKTFGFEFFNGTYINIFNPISRDIKALSINNNFDIVGMYTDRGLITHGFLLTP